MIFFNTIEELPELAYGFAERKHEGQFDKAGKPYIEHVKRVASRIVNDPVAQAVAYLHDVVEDTDTSLDLIKHHFGILIASYVDLLTRRKEESYEDYIDRVSTSSIATQIKIADLIDNMNLARLQNVSKKDVKRQIKYAQALKKLIEKEGDFNVCISDR